MPVLSLAACLFVAAADAQTTFTQPLTAQFAPTAATAPPTTSATSVDVAPNDLASFGTDITNASIFSNGGVFDIVADSTFTAGTTVFKGSAGIESPKTLQITFSRALQVFNNATTSYFASSGTRGITTQTTGGNYSMTFGPVVDGNDPLIVYDTFNVSKVGFLVMSRNEAAVYPIKVKATATMGDSSTQSLTATLARAAGQNVFYGFTAPAGTAITSILLEAFDATTNAPITARIGLDDIGLIVSETGVVVPPPSIANITAENTFVLPGATFDFKAVSSADINPGDVTLTLNGANASSQLSFSGAATDRTLSIGGLTSGLDYTAVATVTNSTGTATRTFNFTTRGPAPVLTDITRNGSYLYPAAQFQFSAAPATNTLINNANVSLTLNGLNAGGQLAISGDGTGITGTISGLRPNQTYRAVVTVPNNSNRSVIRTYEFHTLSDPLTLSDTAGFANATVYPPGTLGEFSDGLTRWAPQLGANQAQIVDSGNPTYGNVFRRTQGTALRADYLYFPALADGKVTLSFDARVSDISHRTLDMSLQPDLGNVMSSFLQFGQIPGKLTYYDNTNYIEVLGFDLDTNWHHYHVVHYFTGPNAKKYDLYIDGVLRGEKLPWRTPFTNPLTRVRIQTNARETALPLEPGEDHDWGEVDNIVVVGMPLDVTPIAPPVATTQLGQGVVYKRFTHTDLYSSKQNIFVTDINLNDPSVGIKFPNSNGTLRTVPTHASNVAGAVAAVNGQFYNVSTFESIQYLKVNGTVVNPTVSASDQQAIIDDGLGTRNSIRMLQRPAAGWDSVPTANIMATGPYLFENGIKWTAYDPADTTFVPVRHPRTAAAWTFDNHLLLVVVDGRSSISEGMTIPELQDYIDHLGWIKFSTNYDGGGSATMWTGSGGVVNSPSDGSPRGVANAITITAAPVATPVTPTSIVGMAGQNQFSLSWQVSSGATSYEIRRSTSASGPFDLIGTTGNNWFTDTSVTPGTTYYYVLIAKNTVGQSLGSAPLGTNSSTAIVVPAVTITRGSGTFSLTFQSQTGRTYQLQRSTSLMTNSWQDVGAAVAGTGGELTLPHTTTGTSAFYRILIQ